MALVTEQYRMLGVKDAKLLQAVASSISKVDLLFVRDVQFDPQAQDITFEGDDTAEPVTILNGMRVTIALDKFDAKAVSNAYGKDKVTSSGLTTAGVSWRLYFGDTAEVNGARLGFECTIDALDETSGSAVELRMTVPVCTINVFRPSNPQYNAKFGTQFVLTAKKTTVDIAGTALPSLPSGPVFWYLDKLV